MKTIEKVKEITVHGIYEDLGVCNYDVEVKWSDGEKGYIQLPSFRIPKKHHDSINKVEKYLHSKDGKAFIKRQWNLEDYKNSCVYHLV